MNGRQQREGTYALMEMSEFNLVSDLMDVSGLAMEQLEGLPDTALTRVLQEVLNPSGETVAAFASALI